MSEVPMGPTVRRETMSKCTMLNATPESERHTCYDSVLINSTMFEVVVRIC